MKKVISYILLITWLFLIFYLSNQPGDISGGESSSIIYHFFEVIYNIFHISKDNINSVVELLHNPIRELMHFLEYLVLSFLVMNVLKQNNIKENIILVSIIFSFIYAVTDEIHQVFIPGRTFEYLDILLDTLGSILGSIIGYKIFWKENVQK